MNNPTWDLNISRTEFKKVLKHPRDKRFRFFFARVLSRVTFYDVFHEFITPQQFQKHYRSVRRIVASDLLGIGRIPFWDWLEKKI